MKLIIWIGLGLGTALALSCRMPPMINDVATDLEDPPEFVKADIGALPERFKSVIREHYSDLKPLVVGVAPAEVFEAVAATAKKQTRWYITFEDAGKGILEGYAVSAVMRFRDDFVVRVRGNEAGGSVVDMRSKSRLGKSDLGANAQRIRDFMAALNAALAPTAKI